jgi:hypothetical protein
LSTYEHRTGRAEAKAVAELVKRYYAASLAGDGAGACARLSASLIKGLDTGEIGAAQGGTHSSCATAIASLLAQQHQHLAGEEPATMRLIGLYAKGSLGLAVLGFRNAPESIIGLTRERNGWRVDALFDSLLP